MEPPQTIDLVHSAMVRIEEQIQDDRVQDELGKDPWTKCYWRRRSIRQTHCQRRSRDDDTWEASKNLVYEDIRYFLPRISIAIKESGPIWKMDRQKAILINAHCAQQLHLLVCDEFDAVDLK